MQESFFAKHKKKISVTAAIGLAVGILWWLNSEGKK